MRENPAIEWPFEAAGSVRGGNKPRVEHLVKLTSFGVERPILGI